MTKKSTFPSHGGQLRSVAQRFGVDASRLIDFSANINPDGPAPGAIASLQQDIQELSSITNYPDLQLTDLKDAIADHVGVPIANLMIANGFVTLLEPVLRFLPIRRCLLPVPAFVEYRKTLEYVGIGVQAYMSTAQSLFAYDAGEMLAQNCDAILLANPQNPSGVCQLPKMLPRLVEEASKRDVYILLDEAFVDYVPHLSLIRRTERFPNLIVFRSVTKFYGIPGLRVAYAVAAPSIASSINQRLPPWPVTSLTSNTVIAVLRDETYVEPTITENQLRRSSLQSKLASLGLRVAPSAANFLLFQIPNAIDPDEFWRNMITDHQIVLRYCADYEGLPKGYFRAAVRTQKDNARLTVAIEQSLSR